MSLEASFNFRVTFGWLWCPKVTQMEAKRVRDPLWVKFGRLWPQKSPGILPTVIKRPGPAPGTGDLRNDQTRDEFGVLSDLSQVNLITW